MSKGWNSIYLSFQRELQVRESKEISSIEEYTPFRRETAGVRLAFSHIECALGIELPDEVYENTVFVEIDLAALDMVVECRVVSFYIILPLKLTSFCRTCAPTKTSV